MVHKELLAYLVDGQRICPNCRMHDVEPRSYLKDLLERLPTMINQDKLDQRSTEAA